MTLTQRNEFRLQIKRFYLVARRAGATEKRALYLAKEHGIKLGAGAISWELAKEAQVQVEGLDS